jgi:hypothetical protein
MAIIPTWRHQDYEDKARTAPYERRRPSQHRCALTKEQTLAVEFYRELETHRTNMETAFRRLRQLLNAHPRLRPGWERFLSNGGATSAQLRECFLQPHTAPRSITPRTGQDLLRVVAGDGGMCVKLENS